MAKHSRFIAIAALAAMAGSCGNVVRDGKAPVLLVIDSLQGIRGAVSAGSPSNVLSSDVITNVTTPDPCSATTPCPTIFPDMGQVVLRLSLKDIGTTASPSAPTSNNEVTITRYHVSYARTDGRNVEGVDVPYAFDGGSTGTIAAGGSLTLGFELVRNIAKQQTPLIQLETNTNSISTIATVTFYGHDQVGNEINVTGYISIDFANFGDAA